MSVIVLNLSGVLWAVAFDACAILRFEEIWEIAIFQKNKKDISHIDIWATTTKWEIPFAFYSVRNRLETVHI